MSDDQESSVVLQCVEELLCSGIKEHSGSRLIDLNNLFDKFEGKYGVYTGVNEKWIHYIRNFIDCWIDASNHDWHYHDPIKENDWVVLANLILDSLRQKKAFDPIKLNGKIIFEF